MTEIIGIDHIYLAVSSMAAAEGFHDVALVAVMGFRKNAFVLDGDPHVQYFNRHFGLVIRPARSDGPHDPHAPGLHHFCLRVESADDVATIADALRVRGIDASPATRYPDYAPDYVATFFTDPDGIRFEVTNYRRERRERHDDWPATA